MMGRQRMSKFQPGDLVRITQNAPRHVGLVRGRPRRVVAVSRGKYRSLYTLGSNGRGECAGEPASDGFRSYAFNSWQLENYEPRHYKFHKKHCVR